MSKMSASIHLQTTSGKSKWSVMDNHGPILNPIPCQPPFRQSPTWLHGPTNWWCCKLIKSNSFCWPKQLEQFFVAKNLNKLKGANADKVLKICQGKMGQISVPKSCFVSRSAGLPFVDSESCQPLKHLALEVRRVALKIWPESKKTH